MGVRVYLVLFTKHNSRQNIASRLICHVQIFIVWHLKNPLNWELKHPFKLRNACCWHQQDHYLFISLSLLGKLRYKNLSALKCSTPSSTRLSGCLDVDAGLFISPCTERHFTLLVWIGNEQQHDSCLLIPEMKIHKKWRLLTLENIDLSHTLLFLS